MTEIGEIYRDLRLGKHVTLKDASNASFHWLFYHASNVDFMIFRLTIY